MLDFLRGGRRRRQELHPSQLVNHPGDVGFPSLGIDLDVLEIRPEAGNDIGGGEVIATRLREQLPVCHFVRSGIQATSSREPYCGSKEGAGSPSKWAWQHSTRYSSTFRLCCRHVSRILRTRSTNRLPRWLSVPP